MRQEDRQCGSPGTDPIKILQRKFYATQFYQDFEWLKIYKIQSESLKNLVELNLRCKIFIGLVPGLVVTGEDSGSEVAATNAHHLKLGETFFTIIIGKKILYCLFEKPLNILKRSPFLC